VEGAQMNGYMFTEGVRQALAKAREEAGRLGHEFVGTEHILLGLIRHDAGSAIVVLRTMQVDLAALRLRIEAAIRPGKPVPVNGLNQPYTSRAKKVLELAMVEARERNRDYVGTEHVLVGLLREEKGIAARVLTDVGVTGALARGGVARLEEASVADGERSATVGERVTADGGRPTAADIIWIVGSGPFSRRLGAVLSELVSAATARGREDFSPEDLLLAILRSGGAARSVIEMLGVDCQRIVRTLEASARSDELQQGPDAPLVTIFAHAAAQGRRITDGALGTDHVLAGILAAYRGPAFHALVDHGVSYDTAMAIIERISG
jgi:ATP-dependent Clp protease ATP-binding subunit ClpA